MEKEIYVTWSEDMDGKYQEAADFAEKLGGDSTIIATNEEKQDVNCMGFVIPNALNLREAPSKSSKVIKILENNEPVFMPISEHKNKRNEWAEVTTADEITGYVMNEFINWV